jgi:hypothetical protein
MSNSLTENEIRAEITRCLPNLTIDRVEKKNHTYFDLSNLIKVVYHNGAASMWLWEVTYYTDLFECAGYGSTLPEAIASFNEDIDTRLRLLQEEVDATEKLRLEVPNES